MNILVACEESQAVTIEARKLEVTMRIVVICLNAAEGILNGTYKVMCFRS